MGKKETKKPETAGRDPDSMSTYGKIAAFVLLGLFALYLIIFGL